MIEIENLSYQYPSSSKKALKNVQLSINKGDLLGLVGPNGAGKTTLISLLTGILQHKTGNITISGYSLPKSAQEIKQMIGYIPQEYAFYPNLTGYENLQFFAGVQGINPSKARPRIEYCLDFCQLKQVSQQRASKFSGGLKRRLNIAIGLLADPVIFLFDEPTVGIDPQSRAFILQKIKSLQRQGKTILYTSHYMEEVEQLCDSIAIIDNGELLMQGKLQSLQQKKLIVTCKNKIDADSLMSLKAQFKLSVEDKKIEFQQVDSMPSFYQVLAELQKTQLLIDSMSYKENNLEQLFLDLTSRKLRD